MGSSHQRSRPAPPRRSAAIITADALTGICDQVLTDGRHGAFNRAIKLAALPNQPYRLLLGAHDVDPFVAHLIQRGHTVNDGTTKVWSRRLEAVRLPGPIFRLTGRH